MIKLIMIDDNPMEHLIMQKIFYRYGLFHDAAHSLDGQIIIDFLRENRQNTAQLPDLIFLDLNMPGFTGFDFLERFEQLYLSFQKPISVYVISSSVDQTDKQRAFAYPFVREFLTKPVKKDKLEHLYATFLDSTAKPVKVDFTFAF